LKNVKEFRNIQADSATLSCQFEAVAGTDVQAILDKIAKENDKLEGWSFR